MQGIWRKVGAAIGTAALVGATFAGAAFAQTTKDLGDYKDLVVGADGSVMGVFVVGADAATADVVSAIDAAAWVSNQQVAGEGGATGGQIVLTPLQTTVTGVKRHVEFDHVANFSYELGTAGTGTDKIGPAGWASGDGVVDFLYSNKEKGPIYFNATEYKWHEEVQLEYSKAVNATRDTLDTNAGDRYDEIFLSVQGNAITYKLAFDTPIPIGAVGLVGKKIWFMGKENTIISARENDVIKLGSTDSEVLLTTSNPTTTVGGVDVTLGGIFAVGTSGTYKAKITLTNGGTTETKFITSDTTDTIAGIETYVKNAVVTTSGTNEGEAQLIVGAGILKLEDNSNLKKGDGTETTWQVILDNSNTAGYFDDVVVRETNPYTSNSGSTKALRPGDSVKFPTELFSLTYTGLENRYGVAPTYVDVDITPTTIDLNTDGDQDLAIQVYSPGGQYISYLDNGSVSKKANKIWLNTSYLNTTGSAATWWYKDDTKTATQYGKAAAAPQVELTPQNKVSMNFTIYTAGYAVHPNKTRGVLGLSEPALFKDGTNKTIFVEYDAANRTSVGAFYNITNGSCYYVYTGDNTGQIGNAGDIAQRYAACTDASITGATRDYITKWGSIIDAVGENLVSLRIPTEQAYATMVFGTSAKGTGKAITVSPGETTTIGGTTVNVTGSVSGGTTVTLPASLAKLDTEVTSADKSTYTLVLVGGPKVNRLVNELQTTSKLTKTIGAGGAVSAKGAGVIELVEDAWGTGKYAVVVAGADRVGTAKAAKVLATFDSMKSSLAGKTTYDV